MHTERGRRVQVMYPYKPGAGRGGVRDEENYRDKAGLDGMESWSQGMEVCKG